MKFQDIVQILEKNRKTLSTMESCTGGLLASMITNVNGSSSVFSYGAVTYSNAAKIKMGVSSDILEKYTVYSSEVAYEMAKAIALFSHSDYGIGITGRLGNLDINNIGGDPTMVYFSIYDKEKDLFISQTLSVTGENREEMKIKVLEVVHFIFLKYLKENNEK